MEKGERKHGCCVRESGMTQGLSRERLGKRGSTREKRARNHSPLDREETLWHKTASTRRDGGIGRRSGLKIRRWRHREGSTPSPGIVFKFGARFISEMVSESFRLRILPFKGARRVFLFFPSVLRAGFPIFPALFCFVKFDCWQMGRYLENFPYKDFLGGGVSTGGKEKCLLRVGRKFPPPAWGV